MNEVKNSYLIYVIAVICILIIITCYICIHIINSSKMFDNEVIIDKTEIREHNNYNMNIKYPLLKNKDINKNTNKFIKDEKILFLESIDNTYENELNINYDYSIINELYSINIKSYSYIGKDNEYHFNNKIIYYDSRMNKEVNINDIVISNKFYEVLRNKCYSYLINNKDKYKIYDDSIIKKRLIADKDNYNFIIFKDTSMEVVFEPHSISEYDTEIMVDIEYSDVIKYLDSDYFVLDDKQVELNTDNVVKNYERIRDSKYFENKKLIALTFDDGPSYDKTNKLIDELNKRDARVTFFMLGQLANKQPDLVKKVYSYGHTIGSHTYDHKNLTKLDDEQLLFEINHTNEILSNIINEDIKYIRPPYGSYNQSILDKTNMAFILWNVDTLDWKLRDAEKVRDYIVDKAKDGDIILLHDIHATSVDGVIMAIDILKEDGYEFVSLDELLIFKNIDIQTRKAYRFFK